MSNENNTTSLLMSAEEAAHQLGISRPTVFQLAHREDFPSLKIGKRLLISRAGLEDWVNKLVSTKMEVAI